MSQFCCIVSQLTVLSIVPTTDFWKSRISRRLQMIPIKFMYSLELRILRGLLKIWSKFYNLQLTVIVNLSVHVITAIAFSYSTLSVRPLISKLSKSSLK